MTLTYKFNSQVSYYFFQKTQSHIDISFNVSNSRETKLDPSFSYSFVRFDKLNGVKLNTRLTLTRPRLIDMNFEFEGVSF